MATVAHADAVQIEALTPEAVRSLLDPPEPPCLSVYLPTHRVGPDSTTDRPAFTHLVEALEIRLAALRSRDVIERLVRPLRLLVDDVAWWRRTQDGLAVLAAGGRARVFLLQRPVLPIAVARPRFHVMPLIRAVTGLERFHVLAVTSRTARVWSGCVWHDPQGDVAERLDPVSLVTEPGSDAVAEVTRGDAVTAEAVEPHRVKHGMGPAGRGGTAFVHGGFGSRHDDADRDTEIFLRRVSELVGEQVPRRSGLPLVLVAAARLAAVYRGLAADPRLLDEGVDRDPHLLSSADLAAAVVPVFTRARDARVAAEVATFEQARGRGRGGDDLAAVARAAVAGRVATLLVEADRLETGRFDHRTGAVELDGRAVGDLSRTGDEPAMDRDDVFGAVAETVFAKGGAVITLPRAAMPTASGVAAVYRYS
jgi:hypothetical protein